jgi:hypothetical protein
MSKVTINVKDGHANIIKTYDVVLKCGETIQDLYEEARRVWAEYYVELDTDNATLSNSYTYEQEVLMYTEHEQYRQFLMMNPL